MPLLAPRVEEIVLPEPEKVQMDGEPEKGNLVTAIVIEGESVDESATEMDTVDTYISKLKQNMEAIEPVEVEGLDENFP